MNNKLNTAEKQQKSVASKFSKIILPLILTIPMAFVAYRYFTAPPAGFCVAQNREFADAEYIKFVTDTKAYNKDQKMVNGKYSVLNCCQVDRIKGDFLSKIFRNDEGVDITWRYERTQESRNSHDPEDKYFGVIQKLDSCATTVLGSTGITEK